MYLLSGWFFFLQIYHVKNSNGGKGKMVLYIVFHLRAICRGVNERFFRQKVKEKKHIIGPSIEIAFICANTRDFGYEERDRDD